MDNVWGFVFVCYRGFDMSTEFKKNQIKRFISLNRAIYIFMILTVFFSGITGLTDNSILMLYYVALILLVLSLDRFVFFRRVKLLDQEAEFPGTLFRVRTCIYIILFSVGGVIDIIPPALVVCIYMCIMYILIQDAIFCEVFDIVNNCLVISIMIFISGIMLFYIQYRKLVNGIWINGFALPLVVVIIVCNLLYLIFDWIIRYMEDRNRKLLFENEEIAEENKKLTLFREKVEKVNSEINYQKIELTKANDYLAESNLETRTLINVMKFFSTSFDIEKNAQVMVENVMELKDARIVGIYISENVYMNENPFIEIKAENDTSFKLLENDITDIYKMVVELGNFEPVVLCENHEFKYKFLTGGNICNAVAFPAFEDKDIYGVMVVASGKYDFFINGYSFYESAVMDFTSALISDRLYLKTEEMAKKDGLTKVYNRVYFNQFYHELKKNVLESGDALTVVMLDIDHFKNVNDTYGHLAGDEVIKMVGAVDNKYAELHQGTAVRFGGEEFLLILRNTGLSEAYDILKDMHNEITSTVVEFEDMKININISMGVSSYKETCDDIDALVDRADQALYYSKTHGRGMIVIDGREEESSS